MSNKEVDFQLINYVDYYKDQIRAANVEKDVLMLRFEEAKKIKIERLRTIEIVSLSHCIHGVVARLNYYINNLENLIGKQMSNEVENLLSKDLY